MRHLFTPKNPPKPHWKRFIIPVLALVMAGFAQSLVAHATPSAPVLLVNHTLRQCIEQVYLSDECSYCRVVNGWEISTSGTCPQGYLTIPYPFEADDSNRPLNCVEVARNDWMACSWGRYPSMTPFVTATPAPLPVDETEPQFFLLVSTAAVVVVMVVGLIVLWKKRR